MTDEESARERLLNQLRIDLMGPTTDDETIRGRPERAYIVGALHPAFSTQDPGESDEALTAESEDDPSDAYAAYGGMKQSAIGLSFTTTQRATLRVDVTYGKY